MAGRRVSPEDPDAIRAVSEVQVRSSQREPEGQHAVEDGPRVAPVLVAVRGTDLPIDLVFGIDEDKTHVLVDAAA